MQETGLKEHENENFSILVWNVYAHDLEMQDSEVNRFESSNSTDKAIQRQIERSKTSIYLIRKPTAKKKKNQDKNSLVKRENIERESFQSLSRRHERTQRAPVRSYTCSYIERQITTLRWSKVTDLSSQVMGPYTVKMSTDRQAMKYSTSRVTKSKRKFLMLKSTR